MSPLPKKTERIEFRAPGDDVDAWRATAEREAMTLSDWIRRTLNAASTRSRKGGK